ncbi:signal recognition particle protein [Rickettsiales bacterium]|nr:signal recognition particle protein [Rickettsiales bacterium]
MFDTISSNISKIFEKISSKKIISEKDVDETMRAIRISLLEADVSLSVAKEFIAKTKEKIIGQDIIKNVKSGDMIVKIFNDQLVELLGSESSEINLDGKEPNVILMAGLQASGKTTTAAKLANFLLKKKNKNKILLASLDTSRPAAMEQLEILAKQIGVDSLEIIKGQNSIDITKRALKKAKDESYEILILDSAGRTNIDEELMTELQNVKKISNPDETILVVDSMMGQDGINVANDFNNRINIDGVILTRIDGNARGGVAITMRIATNCPIKFLGSGEKITELEIFDPERIASRILGMGDIVSLVEKAGEEISESEMKKAEESFRKGVFTFEDLLKQIKNMRKIGGVTSIIGFLPGAGKIKEALQNSDLEKEIKIQEAIIYSMTKEERIKSEILNSSRKKRIATGSGTTIQEVNRLLKKLKQMQKVVKKVGKMDKSELESLAGDGNMSELGNLFGKK